MQIAFLILAHHQPHHLLRLVERISKPWNTIFIHIDKKVDIGEFEYLFYGKKNTLFLDEKNRVNVNWGGFSMVRATLQLINIAQQYPINFDRYCLLSGSDYPIKNTDEILKGLKNDTEYMLIGSKISKYSTSELHTKFIKYYYFDDYPLLKKIHLSGKLWRNQYKRINLYHGTQWFCLSFKAIEYIIKFIKTNPDYVRFMKYTHCSDEIFFVSILKASPYAHKISHDFEQANSQSSYYLNKVHGIHYVDWINATNKGCSPRELTMIDKKELEHTDALFARKVDQNRSSYLLGFLDTMLDSSKVG